MAKKDFTAAAAGMFVEKMTTPTQPQEAAPRRQATTTTRKTAQEEKITFMLDAMTAEKVRCIVWQEKAKLKAVLAEALQMYVADYEQKNGEIKTR